MLKAVNLISSNIGKIVPDSVDDYIRAGGFEGLKKAMSMESLDLIEEVKKSKLMGRGGAGYPTGVKLEQAYAIKHFPKYIICNADEGEPGTFKDKMLITGDPLKLLEGMAIAGYILKANNAYIYVRGEYRKYQRLLKSAIDNAEKAGYLGNNILGTDFNFHVEILSGAGAYVCGENSALIESCEGKAGRPRIKPPFIKVSGIFNMPTLLNNVETFAALPYITINGGDKYASYGTEFSGGTKLICLSGNIAKPGVYEIPFGASLREIIYDIGGGIPNGRKLKLVQIGGASGPCIPDSLLDTKLCYKALKNAHLALGTGSLLVVDDSNSVIDLVECILDFFIDESCGKCTPCREGNRHLKKILNKFKDGTATQEDYEVVARLSNTMKIAAFCGLGQTSFTAFNSCLKYFKDEFDAKLSTNRSSDACLY